MEPSQSRQNLLFQFHGTPPIGTSISLALQHLVAMIVGCVTPPIIMPALSACPRRTGCC